MAGGFDCKGQIIGFTVVFLSQIGVCMARLTIIPYIAIEIPM